MKNRSTPQKSNLPHEDDKMLELLETSGREELALREELLGKNTHQAARILAKEFVKRFGGHSGTVASITSRFVPAGRATSWQELDLNIVRFCETHYRTWELEDAFDIQTGKPCDPLHPQGEELLFFERVAHVLQSLPRRLDYKVSDRNAGLIDPVEIARNFTTCHLCWRSVARKPLERKSPLCHLHDLPSSDGEYRRRKRMRVAMLDILRELSRTVPSPARIKQSMSSPAYIVLRRMCRELNGPLPYLARYLASLDLPREEAEDLMRALEHPLYFQKLSPVMREAWEIHFADRAAYFEYNYRMLLLAEAWLRAEAEYKHGGKR